MPNVCLSCAYPVPILCLYFTMMLNTVSSHGLMSKHPHVCYKRVESQLGQG